MRVDPQTLTQAANWIAAYAQNSLEVLRYGGLETGEQPAPHQVEQQRPMYRLRRYFADDHGSDTGRPPVVLVHPMMLSAELWDVSATSSIVSTLHAAGLDPWVVDFGSPDTEDGGRERTLTDHVVAISEIVDTVGQRTGRPVHLAGYCQGGMLCYQAAAYRRSKNLASLVTFGSPTDFSRMLPPELPQALTASVTDALADHVFSRVSIPAWAARLGFTGMYPMKMVRTQIDFIRQLHNREALAGSERQRRYITGAAYTGWSGPAIVELIRQIISQNRMMTGGFVIDGRPVSLADITCPILAFVGEFDDIGKPDAVRGVTQAVPDTDVYEIHHQVGHLGLVLGSAAARITWPSVVEWIRWQEGNGPKPVRARLMDPAKPLVAGPRSTTDRAKYAVAQLADIGVGASKDVATWLGETAHASQEIANEAMHALPRLIRLGRVQNHTRVSFSAVLAEQAARSPGGECFLFDERAHTNAAVAERIDNVVRGLIHVGIRQGDHVGVLMETRPSALVAIAALSRLGAVAVLLPPDDVPGALRQTRLLSILVDPDNLATVADSGRQLLVLGGGEDRRIDGGVTSTPVIDLEQIDPASVVLPRWYRPDPGLARDLAFVLFSRTDGDPRPRPITNHRWALSAFGTASAAGLTRADTVYCITPLHHPSGLLTAVGGAVAGGSRIALSRVFDPSRFTEEVRRYGVTVVSYTWTMLRELVADPRDVPAPGVHIRLFLGSGMPVSLRRRITERFAQARIVELYASIEGEAVLVNLSDAKPGAKGRPLPGSAEVRLAAYDPITTAFIRDDDGFIRECEPGEVGLLLANPKAGTSGATRVMRGVFRSGDTWQPTGDLFRRDADGDFWLVDNLRTVITTRQGLVFTHPISEALGGLHSVDLAAVYLGRSEGREVVIAAVTLVSGAQLSAADLDRAMSILPADQRPDLVQTVEEMPVTKWYRPDVDALRQSSSPAPGSGSLRYDVALATYTKSDDRR